MKTHRLLYGTSNKSKIRVMNDYVASLDIEILSLDDISTPLPDIDETGSSPLENARIKALAYYKALSIPVFSCDSGLYIDELPDARQPGVYVRRINGRRLNDAEMITHYASIAEEFGGSVTARYQNAICLVLSETAVYEYAGPDIASRRFKIVTKPHPTLHEGFPIDSLSVDIQSGMYYYDIGTGQEKYFAFNEGFAGFFKKALGL